MRRALVIGIDNYKDHELHGCVNDARSMAEVLECHGDGEPNFTVKLLTVPLPDSKGARDNEDVLDGLTHSDVDGEIEALFADDPEIALLYFSGHGSVSSLGGAVATTDFQARNVGMPMDDILNYANHSKAKDKVILLDCCHSGAFGSPTIDGGDEKNVCRLSSGLTVLTASRDTQTAEENNGRGVFTSLLVDALKGGAADLRGQVTSGSIYAYVDQALGPWDQRPIFKTNVSHSSALRMVTAPVPHATLRKLLVFFPDPEGEHQLTPECEFTHASAQPEKIAIFKDLQKMAGVGLVVPVGEEHMYFAAINSKSCKLTAMGRQYWRLAREKRL